jgi:GH15 family glucan-1,4-alpha-glucosidase
VGGALGRARVHAGRRLGGLRAAECFADLFGDAGARRELKHARDGLLAASDAHLYRPELGRFARRLTVAEDGSVAPDEVLDSAMVGLWRFGMYAPDDDRIVATMEAIREGLANRAAAGGLARYANDYYFQVEHDLALTPGNPWIICSLWLAQWYIATARTSSDLRRARTIVDWAVHHQMQSGMLAEQIHPHTGAPLSVAPLTWSHAELVVTVDDYIHRASSLRRTR